MIGQITIILGPWLQAARMKYGVDPVLFFVLMTVCAPVFYYSIYRMVRAIAARQKATINLWSMVFLISTVLPYVYILFFGRNLPWWVYLIVGVLMAQSGYAIVMRRKGKSSSP
jgi:hypothetical protein